MTAYYNQISDEQFREIVESSISYAEVMRKLGYTANRGNSYSGVKEKIKSLNIDTSHFKGQSHGTSDTTRYSLEEILVKDSPYTNMTSLKKRILDNNLLDYKCAICGITEWNNKPLVLQLDHINGDNRDNRLENLRLLCPNCHSQTETFCRKNVVEKEPKKYYCERCGAEITRGAKLCKECSSVSSRKVLERPSSEDLLSLLLSNTFVEVGQMYGVSDNTIRGWCREYGIPSTRKGLKEYQRICNSE